jgi:pyruvate formate lyase activating enzyme
MAKGVIFDIKEMSVNDGPGVRTAIFLKGCPLRCNWCHNPEGFLLSPQLKEAGPPCTLCGKCLRGCGHEDCRPYGRCLHVCPLGRLSVCGREVDSAELAAWVKRQAQFLSSSGGGVTLSGGEPLMQPEFLLALMEELKPLHVAVETSAYAEESVFREMVERADLVMADIKHMEDEVHRRYTGVGNVRILSNLSYLMESGRPFIIRVPLIPGVNDGTENLEQTAAFLQGAGNLHRVELLPYNTLAGAKYRAVGLEYKPLFDGNAHPIADCTPFTRRGIPCMVL